MIRHGQENVAIADRLHRCTRAHAAHRRPGRAAARCWCDDAEAPVPDPAGGASALWGVSAAYADAAFAQPVSDDVKSFAASLTLPYCGVNAGFEAAALARRPGHA